MTKELDLNQVREEYFSFRDKQQTLQMATIDARGLPESSYAPFVWFEGACYLFLSALAQHTQNLNLNSSIGLLLIEDEVDSRNQFARRRIIYQGQVSAISRTESLYREVMSSFRERFGNFIDIIEPLQDFQLFEINPQTGRYIRGFAQAFQLSGEGLEQIEHIKPNQS